ncbi:putative cytidylate kinase [Nucleospora cyclopteri]
MKTFTIAIDGPAASGKSSAAEKVAEKLGFMRLDGGSLYRALTFLVLQEFNQILDETDSKMKNFVESINLKVVGKDVFFDGKNISCELRTDQIDENVGILSKILFVRNKIHKIEREICEKAVTGIVVDGRDIGTVVLPNASLKFFITASAETRAKRRVAQNQSNNYEKILEEIKKRDLNDINRTNGPLRRAEDAILIENDDITLEQTVELILIEFNKKYK